MDKIFLEYRRDVCMTIAKEFPLAFMYMNCLQNIRAYDFLILIWNFLCFSKFPKDKFVFFF